MRVARHACTADINHSVLNIAETQKAALRANALRFVLLGVLMAVLLALTAAALPALTTRGEDGPITNPTDFRAFYCAGVAIDVGRDPYRTQPMWGCQRDVLRSYGLIIDDRHVLPAPLPPYGLALFALIARLPFSAASPMWLLLGIGAVITTIAAVQRLSRLSLAVTALSLIAAEGWASLVIGQVVPFVVCALAAAALALRERRYGLAAGLTTFAMIEPHVALPVVAALAFAVPAMRRPLAIGLLLLGTLSLVAVGPAVCWEYVTQVLPLHSRSEVTNYEAQYSLSSLLWLLGAGVGVAVTIAELSYAALVAAAAVLARGIAQRYRDDAFIVTTPLAFALAGGPFMHIHQIAAALPFALMLLGHVRVPRAARVAQIAALIALAVPWQTVAEVPAVAAALGYTGRPAAASTLPSPEPDAIAEVPEIRFLELVGGYRDRRSVVQSFIKLPTWFGLATLAGSAIALGRRRKASGWAVTVY